MYRYASFLLIVTCLFQSPAAMAIPPVTSVEHALGEATIAGHPDRVVSLYQGATDTAVALGIEPIGVVESWTEKPMYHYLRNDIQNVTYLGLETQPDLERIAWLSPDLIIGARNRHRTIYPLLDRIAPTVIPGDVYDFKALLALMAKATGRTARGEELLTQWQERVKDFRTRIQNKLGEQWPQEVAILSFRADHARIYYDGFARSVLDELGFTAPVSHRQEGWGIKLTSQESIPAMDAEAVFIFMEDDPAVQRTFNTWSSHPLWKNLKAVQQNDVYQVDPVTWNMGAGIIAANLMLDELYQHYDLHQPERQGCPRC
ncbi:iron-siderophore ABC transporter substrate-binding protein [Marinobacter salarius]|jgi:iron complex transport system substrate-binding protein|uniref:ABC transporter substrate-binding protein n=1 Tax=Marinobacter salarius TaxID=1420917 RepID=UPI0018F160E6|nr:iron-siderophore ABC transporter substrate-binding protein [Marinobacter salarius]MBJ7275036.1 iron-siderophore ABC transporter substrate-binding protein [Marinobacter salarius]